MVAAARIIELPGGHLLSMQPLTVEGRTVARVTDITGEHGDLTMVEVADLMHQLATADCDPRGDHERARKLRALADRILNSRD